MVGSVLATMSTEADCKLHPCCSKVTGCPGFGCYNAAGICLLLGDNFMNREARQAIVQGIAESQTTELLALLLFLFIVKMCSL